MSNEKAKVLWYQDLPSHDKIHVTVYDGGTTFTTYWGKRGQTLSSKPKFGGLADFHKIVSEKEGKGYKNVTDTDILKNVMGQVLPAHAEIISKEYGLSKPRVTSSGAPFPDPRKVKTPVAPKTVVNVTEENPVVVVCQFECNGFEKGVEYYCMKYTGKVMKVQDMHGDVVYVDMNNFTFKAD